MPSPKLVTGVSTGSMIAPFAFLGGSYIGRLRTLYTTIKPDDISEDQGLLGALFGEALADTEPLARLIESRDLRESLRARCIAQRDHLSWHRVGEQVDAIYRRLAARRHPLAPDPSVSDRLTRKTYQVSGRTVILCAQALESTRILFNSKTREHPAGLANSSGLLGRFLMDHAVGAGASAELPDMEFKKSASDPNRPNGIYVIRFRNLKAGPRHPRFIRGYGFQGGAAPDYAFGAEGFGASYKNAVKKGVYGIHLGGFGESLARLDNYCEIDPALKDAWGIPALRISMTHGSNEAAMMEDAAVTAAEMLEAAGARNITLNAKLAMPGMAIHELGTARMGDDPKKSVLNAYNQAHDVKNLFVFDGACFVSSGCQNPTLTMMAITVRACDHLVERFKKNEV